MGSQDARRDGPVETEPLQQGRPRSKIVGGRFVIDRLIARGGMGAVYLAHQLNLGRPVALKIMTPPPDSEDGDTFEERFRLEAETLAALHHPNIVTVYDYGPTEDGRYYLALEYIEGPRFTDLIRKGRMAPERAVRLMLQVCNALRYAHKRGVVHRDLKPSNLLVRVEDGVEGVKVVDFGLVKVAEADQSLTRAGLVLGSPQDGNPNFEYSPCHEHYHFLGYAEYQLLDAKGDEAARGQKQAFCLVDTEKFLTEDPTVSDAAKYSCVYQGIQRGWSDVYHARLPCQWIDVTDVAPGDYSLRVRINTAQSLPELDYANNTEDIAVTIGDPDLSQPTEPCPATIPRRASAGEHRECGWVQAGTFACEPGRVVRIGCASACNGLGTCTGNPIMRVCDSARPDGNCSYAATLATSDNACESSCPRVKDLFCPASGSVHVYTAPYYVGDPYTCELAFDYQDG